MKTPESELRDEKLKLVKRFEKVHFIRLYDEQVIDEELEQLLTQMLGDTVARIVAIGTPW